VRGLRIAWGVDFCGLPMEPRVRSTVNANRQTFEDLGCVTEDAWPNLEGANEVFQVLRAVGLASGPLGTLLKDHRSQMKETAVWNVEQGFALTGEQVVNAERARGLIFLRMVEFMEQYDALALPVSQVAPFSIDEEYVKEIDGVRMETYIDWMQSCSFITTTAHPAISVPGGFTQEGLPVGLQLVGKYHGEVALLQLAHAFEQATLFGSRRPDIAIRR
jgi:amidase